MFRSKAFSARPVYFLGTVKSRPDIAMDLRHGKKDACEAIESLEISFEIRYGGKE
jgi:hypothetical protein